MMSNLSQVFLTVLVCSLAPAALARLADQSEAGARRHKHDISCEVFESGAHLCEHAVEIEILNETARETFSKLRQVYSPKTTRLKVTAAAVKNGQSWEVLTPDDILDQENPAKQAGFDQMRRVTVAFPNVRVGSVIAYKLAIEVFRPGVEGHFSKAFTIGENILDMKTRIQITSRIPLYYHLQDPQGVVRLQRQLKPEGQRLYLETKRPLFRALVEEEAAFDEGEDLTTFEVSTAVDSGSLGRKLGLMFDARDDVEGSVLAALGIDPESLRRLAAAETFDAVTSALSGRFRYFGDWRAQNGAYVPRSLTDIIAKGYGDCKDLSLLLSAVLREMGYPAQVAAVYRSEDRPLPRRLVHLSDYNHVIVWVRHQGRDYWLDPTNKESFASGIPDDIAGRPALILDPIDPVLLRIAELVPGDNRLEVDHHVIATSDGVSTVQARLSVAGEFATGFTGLELADSREQVTQDIADVLTMGKKLLAVEQAVFDLKSVIVQPQTMTARLTFADYFIESDRGPVLSLSSSVARNLLALKLQDRVSGYGLPMPSLYTFTVRIPRPEGMDKLHSRCHADSPWLRFERRIRKDDDVVEVVTETTVKVTGIPARELVSTEFAEFRRELRKCVLPEALVLE